jgi:flagellar protein FliS
VPAYGQNAYAQNAYLETEILAADPLRLVQLLYQAALQAVGNARSHLRKGEIRERSRQITRAMEALAELTGALDVEKGGEIAANLARLYDYMSRRLQEANAMQVEPPLIEVERLLNTLLDAWKQCTPASAPVQDTAPHALAAPASWMAEERIAAYTVG